MVEREFDELFHQAHPPEQLADSTMTPRSPVDGLIGAATTTRPAGDNRLSANIFPPSLFCLSPVRAVRNLCIRFAPGALRPCRGPSAESAGSGTKPALVMSRAMVLSGFTVLRWPLR